MAFVQSLSVSAASVVVEVSEMVSIKNAFSVIQSNAFVQVLGIVSHHVFLIERSAFVISI